MPEKISKEDLLKRFEEMEGKVNAMDARQAEIIKAKQAGEQPVSAAPVEPPQPPEPPQPVQHITDWEIPPSNDISPVTPLEETREIDQEIQKLPEGEREEIAKGLYNIGFRMEKAKNDFFAKALGVGRMGLKKPGGTVDRFAQALQDSYIKEADLAYQKAKDLAEGKGDWSAKLKNPALLVRDISKYGRIVADLTTHSFASPLRYVMMAGAAGTRLASAGKEARLKNEKVIEKTRIGKGNDMQLMDNLYDDDIARAQEEAFKLYRMAGGVPGSEERKPSAEAIKKEYLMQLPEDLWKRLQIPAVGNSFMQKIIKTDLEFGLTHMEHYLAKINENKKLSWEQKEVEREKIVKKFRESLEDYDRIITQYGTVDGLAMASRYAQTAGKAVVASVQVETLLLSLDKMMDITSKTLAHSEIFSDTKEWVSKFYEDGKNSLSSAFEKLKFWESEDSGADFTDGTKEVSAGSPSEPARNTTPTTATSPQETPRFTHDTVVVKPEPAVTTTPDMSKPAVAPEATASPTAESVMGKPPTPEVKNLFADKEVTFEKGKGGIEAVKELRAQIRDAYKGDYSGAPKSVQEFMSGDMATKKAMELGLYDPEATDESAMMHEGWKLGFDKDGNLLLGKPDADGNIPKFGEEKFEMFDSDKGGAGKPPAPETATIARPDASTEDLERLNKEKTQWVKGLESGAEDTEEDITPEEIQAKENRAKTLKDLGYEGDPGDKRAVKEFLEQQQKEKVLKGYESQAPQTSSNINRAPILTDTERGVPLTQWKPFSNISAKEVLRMKARPNDPLSGPLDQFSQLLKNLSQLTGENPKGRGFMWLGKPETAKEFFDRTLTILSEKAGRDITSQDILELSKSKLR